MSQKQEVDINIHTIVDKEGNPREINHSKKSNKNIHSSEKLQVSLTVAQMAYLCRILIDLKIIRTNNISDLIRFISRNISTPKAADISFDSFKVKFYNPDSSTIRSVNDLIIRQLNYIRKYSSRQ